MKTITVKEDNGLGEKTNVYGVNNSGNGLWLNGKQIVGTCDFHASSPSELIRKLRKDLEPGFETIKKVRGSNYGW